MKSVLEGLVGGVVGTFAMTLAKERLFPLLDEAEQYPLPPREITQDVVERVGAGPPSVTALTTGTIASHLAFGVAAALLFTALGLHRRRPVAAGAAYGLGVWAISYLGWLPLFGILIPATHHPRRRNALMIAVHLVWGSATGYAAWTIRRSRSLYGGRGPLPDRHWPQRDE